MTIEVSIERDSAGRLHGYVLERREDGSGGEWIDKGDDLLSARVFRNIDSAVQECDAKLMALFKLIDPPKIDYVFPGKEP